MGMMSARDTTSANMQWKQYEVNALTVEIMRGRFVSIPTAQTVSGNNANS
jgi:hypothetical protein